MSFSKSPVTSDKLQVTSRFMGRVGNSIGQISSSFRRGRRCGRRGRGGLGDGCGRHGPGKRLPTVRRGESFLDALAQELTQWLVQLDGAVNGGVAARGIRSDVDQILVLAI